MIWISAAWALDPLYDCPTVTVPADALVYRSTGSVGPLMDEIQGLAAPYIPEECEWVETATEDLYGYETTWVCDDGAVHVEIVSGYSYYGDEGSDWYTTTVVAPEPWEEIRYGTEGSWASVHAQESSGRSWIAWTGSIDGLPSDDNISIQMETSEWSDSDRTESITVSTPLCDWETGDVLNSFKQGSYAYVEGGGHTVAVYDVYDWTCLEDGVFARMDDVRVGNVDPVTWELYPDTDGDTYGGDSDCDDTRADVYVCANEIDDDGIDQDCDGSDSFDTDGDLDDDGSDGALAGGADCDDDDRAVHPGADDPAGDGVDTDCDGADDVDADNDGYTADGDNRQADCDDADPLIFPGADEIAQDGIDQDCRGGDDLDADQDGFDTPRDCDDNNPGISPTSWDWACDGIDQDCNGEDPCTLTVTPEPERGCGAAAWVFLVPLLGFGASRRSRRG